MPQNIKINNVRSLDCKVLFDEYYDFMLYKGEAYGAYTGDECLAADFSKFDIDENGKIHSLTSWAGAINEGAKLNDIGLTGIDNGFITYRKDRISNYEFMNILTGSTYSIDSADTRFFLSPISGNTLEYVYPMSTVTEDGEVKYLSLDGGFYQGFYKLHGFDYQTLPNKLENGWTLNFVLRPHCNAETKPGTINAKHPENNGIFFYMGTRAENKFWEFYPNNSASAQEFIIANADNDGYMANDCEGEEDGEIYSIYHNDVAKAEYLQDEPEEEPETYFLDGYAASVMTPDSPCYEDLKKKGSKSFEYGKPKGEYYYGAPSNDCGCAKRTVRYNDCVQEAKKHSRCTESDVRKRLDNMYVGWYMGAYNYYPEGYCNACACNGAVRSCCAAPGNDYAEVCKCCEDYFVDDYYNSQCVDGPKAIELDYMMEDLMIDDNGEGITTSIGQLFNRTGYYEIVTDNKFIFFNRTKTGFTVCNWTEGSLVSLTGRRNWSNANYFILMNRTCTGWTTDTIEQYNEMNEKPYDIYKDIRNNAFALRITSDGSIGYKYGVLDCETSAASRYKVIEEYSKSGMVKCDEWNNITVKIAVLNPTYSQIVSKMTLPFGLKVCENDGTSGTHKMKIYVYVNGYLKLVSKELPEFVFRELNEDYAKQEGVPFNISLGGGTQGLMETIGPDYMNISKYMLPLERDFGGSFLGDIKSFKMYDCPLNYSTIKDYLSKNNQ